MFSTAADAIMDYPNLAAKRGIMLGIAGLDHGFFETLQGNTATNGWIIQAIGDAQQMWIHGTEEAFTIVPNFLSTGLLAIAVSIAIMIWSVRFMDTKYGSTMFILLFGLHRREVTRRLSVPLSSR